MKPRQCKHSKPVEREWDGDGHMHLFCYSCSTDINADHRYCDDGCRKVKKCGK